MKEGLLISTTSQELVLAHEDVDYLLFSSYQEPRPTDNVGQHGSPSHTQSPHTPLILRPN